MGILSTHFSCQSLQSMVYENFNGILQLKLHNDVPRRTGRNVSVRVFLFVEWCYAPYNYTLHSMKIEGTELCVIFNFLWGLEIFIRPYFLDVVMILIIQP